MRKVNLEGVRLIHEALIVCQTAFTWLYFEYCLASWEDIRSGANRDHLLVSDPLAFELCRCYPSKTEAGIVTWSLGEEDWESFLHAGEELRPRASPISLIDHAVECKLEPIFNQSLFVLLDSEVDGAELLELLADGEDLTVNVIRSINGDLLVLEVDQDERQRATPIGDFVRARFGMLQ
jgi:hypothetical protein